ncbi:MAG TPA: alpha/beta hydrolase [Longimicrobium sp.]|nr:alpha/beta hydrolase [Longimicrobium sp.]
MRQAVALTFALLLAPSIHLAAQANPAPAAALEPCELPGVGAARCGSLEVWENRQSRSGRKITLRFAVLPATGAATRDPVVPLPGGPGQPTLALAGPLTEAVRALRDTRDILLVDLRGTGTSNPLSCPLYGPSTSEFTGPFYPPQKVRECARELGARADVALYTTDLAVDDLDDVRAALGYDRLNLYGTSYGTRAALVYMRRHPAHVRSAVLHSVAHTGYRMPSNAAPDAQRMVEAAIADCEREAPCGAAFPGLRDDLRTIVERLDAGPVDVTLMDPGSGDPVTLAFSRGLFAEGLRYMMYTAGTAALIPTVLHQGGRGDLAPAAELALASRRGIVTAMSNGLFLSVTCAEDVPFVDRDQAARAARGTFVGESRLRDQMAACAEWPVRPVDPAFLEPVRSDAPVLVISGQDDPATPPEFGDQALRTLPNGRHLVIPGAGHGLGGSVGARECVPRLIAEFLRSADARGLDASCVASIHRPPFRLAPIAARPVTLPPGELAAHAGTFATADGPPVETRIENGRLRLTVQGQTFALAPVGPEQFRVVGQPQLSLTFAREGGVVKTLVVEGTGQGAITYTRR